MRLGDNRAMDVKPSLLVHFLLILLRYWWLPMGRIVEIYGPESSVNHSLLNLLLLLNVKAKPVLLLMQSMHLTLFMRKSWALI